MKFLNDVKKYSIIAIAICAVLGILFVAFPAKVITYLSLTVGIALIVMGLAGIIGYLANKNSGVTLALGIISAIGGIIICVKYQAIISIIVVIIGVFILATGVFNLVAGIKIVASRLVSGWVSLAMSIADIVFGIVAITKSTQLTEGIVQFLGVALIFYAILDTIIFIQVKMMMKNAKKQIIDTSNEIEIDGNEVD